MNTTVVNIKTTSLGEGIYIGRPSIFGNPFVIGRDGNRDEVIAKFKNYAEEKFEDDREWALRVRKLRGQTLVCHCAPLACHGDVLKELAHREIGNQMYDR